MSDREWRRVDALPFVASWAYFLALAPYGLNLDDEGTLLYQIYRAAVGQLLYRDFHAGYTPGVYSLNAFLWNSFGVNVLYVRWLLSVVNAASVQLIYLLGRRAGAGRIPAALAAASYVALIPFYDGNFLSANIPYPIWYVVFFWLKGLFVLTQWWRSGRLWWVFALGVLGGLVFWFKPNSGVLACGGFLTALVCLTHLPDNDGTQGWAERAAAWVHNLLPWVFVLGVVWMISSAGSLREQLVLALPVAAVVVLARRGAPALDQKLPAARLWALVGSFAAGFLLVTLPWTLYYWSVLGTRWFLRAVLFIGTDFERFYYIAYPHLSDAGLATGGAIALLAIVVAVVRIRLLPRWLVWVGAVVALCGAAVWLWRNPPPMIEGWSASVIMRVRELSFALALWTLWSGIGLWWLRQRRLERARKLWPGEGALPVRLRREQAVLVILLLGAVAMHVQLYPRADFMHLVPAVPGLLVVGAWVLSRGTERAAVVLVGLRRWGRRLAAASLLPVAVVVASMVAPAVQRAAYLLRAEWTGDRTALVELAHPRAPLLIEPAAGRLFLSLRDTARFLAERSSPGEFVFTFPVLDVLLLLSDRHNPTRHGYFYPGWPGHAVEAEVLDDLRTRPPRWIVLLHEHPLFFATAPVYFFNLRRYVTEAYALERRIGMFELLRRADAPGQPFAAEEPEPMGSLWRRELASGHGATQRTLLRLLENADAGPGGKERLAAALVAAEEEVRCEFVRLVRKSRSRECAVVLALLLEAEENGSRCQQLAIRALSEIAREESVPALLRAYESRPELRPWVAGILFNVGSKVAFETYWFSSDEVEREPRFRIDSRTLAEWMDDPFQSYALRSFAIRTAGLLRDPAGIPVLVRLLGDSGDWRDLAAQAADSLAALGYARWYLPAIVSLIPVDPLWVPAVVAQQWNPKDSLARARLEGLLALASGSPRQVAFWIAAGVRDPSFQPWLEAGVADADREVRIASAWGLGELGEKSAIEVLERALENERNDEVRRFLLGAMRKLGAG